MSMGLNEALPYLHSRNMHPLPCARASTHSYSKVSIEKMARSIGPYLLTCLSKLADSLKSDVDFIEKISIPICPACKALGDREYLVYDGKMLRCQTCTQESVRVEAIKKEPLGWICLQA